MINCCDASACFPRLGVIVGDVKLLFVRMDVDDSGLDVGSKGDDLKC